MIEPKIKPFRSLQTTAITFGLVVTLIFGFWLTMASNERISSFVKYHRDISNNATKNISHEIERILLQRSQLVGSFMEDNRQIIADIVKHPENEEFFARLNSKLSRYFSDYFSSNIATAEGELVVDDFEGDIGELCLADLQHYMSTGQQQVRIHPNHKIYHYDILVEFEEGGERKVLIVTFSAEGMANLLKASTPDKHNLVITDSNINLIEITSEGSRNMMKNRLDFRLTEEEKSRVISSAPVQGTYWDVIDIHSEDLFVSYRNKVLLQGFIVGLFFVIMTALMILSLLMGVRKQNKLEQDLLENNREISALNQELEKLSLTDSLTGLNNRRYFDTNASSEFNKAKRLEILLNIAIIDIDYFKRYNDTYGHQDGDACLVKIAEILDNYFKRSNETVARYGGEEFIIMNMGDTVDEFTERLTQLSSLIEKRKIEHTGSRIGECITISVGVASTADIECNSVRELIRASDSALYMAKGGGRNRVVVFSESPMKRVTSNK